MSVDSKWRTGLRATRHAEDGRRLSRLAQVGGVYETPLLAVEVASRDGELYRVFIEGASRISRPARPRCGRARRQFARRGHDARGRETDAHDAARAAELRRSDALRARRNHSPRGGCTARARGGRAGNAALFVRKTLSKMRVTSS